MWVRGVRGATVARENTREAILSATREMLEKLVEANGMQVEDIASVFFSTTRATVTPPGPFTPKMAAGQFWHVAGRASLEVTVVETGDSLICTADFSSSLTCPSNPFGTAIYALAAGTYTVEVRVTIGSGSSGDSAVSGRAVTLTALPG